MAHIRKKIRDAVGGSMLGLSLTASRVFVARVYPLEDAELPAWKVDTGGETSQQAVIGIPHVLERRLIVTVVFVAKAIAGLADLLDQAALEAEVALAYPCAQLLAISQNIDINLIATDPRLTGTVEKPLGELTLTYEVKYMSTETAPDVAL
jgi:uncharacterized membrane protein